MTSERGDTYVVCLDCAQQFAYDLREMRMGKRIKPAKSAVLRPEVNVPRRSKPNYALWLSVPAALLAGLLLKLRKPAANRNPDRPEKP